MSRVDQTMRGERGEEWGEKIGEKERRKGPKGTKRVCRQNG